MAQKDLIPISSRTKEEQLEITRKGGIKSGIARRKKRELKEKLLLGLEVYTKLKANQLKKNGNNEQALILNEIGLVAYELLNIVSNDKNIPQVKMQAINDILDRTEGKPTQKNVIDANIGDNKELSPKEIILIDRKIKKEAKKLKWF